MTTAVATILHLEDSDLDAELVRDRLQKAGLAVAIELVSNRKDFVVKLQERRYDLILSDYQVPTFNGLAALELARAHQPETPFIFVSGAMGEEFAVETLKRGATDYVLKQRLTRLPAAIERALEARRAAADLRASESRLQFALKAGRMGTWDLEVKSQRLTCSDTCKANYGRAPDEPFTYQDLTAAILPEDLALWQSVVADAATRVGDFEIEYRVRWPDGSLRWVQVRGSCAADAQGQVVTMSGVSFDITDRKRAEQDLARLLADEKRHNALLEQVALASRSINAVLSAESIARILTVEARSILGAQVGAMSFTRAEDGTHEVQVVSVADGKAALPAGSEPAFDPELAVAVCRSGRPVRRPAQQSGPGRWGRVAAPLIGHGGKNLGVVQLAAKQDGDFTSGDEAVAMQLAAIAAVGLENARLYELLREQDKRKDEFLATLAHELRNPLAPVRNGLQILKVAGNGEQASKIREMMERQLGHMVRLIDDLMDVSRITRGRVELRRERVELRNLVDSALEASRPLVESAGHALAVRVPKGIFLDADPTRMAQVIANLLNNSAKYTPEGGRITLTAERQGPSVLLRVTDTGVGIPAEMLPQVFDMFTQVGRTLDRSQGGLGIGLTLVRRLVEMHGGTVEVESPGPGLGTTFTLHLPVAGPAEPARPRAGSEAEGQASRRLRILVVDDNIDGAESLAMLLRLGGHKTLTANTGAEALTTARSFLPDLMFLDIGLPGMDGYEVAARLRAEERQRCVLVALTGWGSEDDRRRSKSVGFDHHLTKPVDAEALEKLIEQLAPRV
jgi:signal transduction histidine kinase/DNA-binding response OmpR family regulator